MTILFETFDGGVVFINPEQVIAIEATRIGRDAVVYSGVVTTAGRGSDSRYLVRGDATAVAMRLGAVR